MNPALQEEEEEEESEPSWHRDSTKKLHFCGCPAHFTLPGAAPTLWVPKGQQGALITLLILLLLWDFWVWDWGSPGSVGISLLPEPSCVPDSPWLPVPHLGKVFALGPSPGRARQGPTAPDFAAQDKLLLPPDLGEGSASLAQGITLCSGLWKLQEAPLEAQ